MCETLTKMNNRMGYLLKAVRYLCRCSPGPRPSAPTSGRIVRSSRHRDHLENVNYRKLFLNTFPSLRGSPVQFLSQKADVFGTGDEVQQEKNSEAALSEQAPQSSLEMDKLDAQSFRAKAVQDQNEQFFNRLHKCACPSDVLDLASESAVSIKQFTNCLTTMWKLLRNMSEDQRRYEKRLIFEHPAFVRLCQQLLQHSRRMTRGDLVFSLHTVVNLGVPQNTLLVQTLLRVCQEKLNQLDNRCMSVLATTLARMDEDKNVSALQAGLQLLVEQRLPSIRDISILQNLMKCMGKDAPIFLKKKLEVNLSGGSFLLPQKHCFLVLHLFQLRLSLICIISCCSLQYRNIKLFSTVADYVNSVVSLLDKRQIILFLSAFESLGFQPSELMGVLAEKVTEDSEFLDLKSLLIVLRVYSRLNYIPRGQHHLFYETLHSCLNKYLPQISNAELLKAVYSLCILGYLPHRALDQLLKKDNFEELVSGDLYKEKRETMLHCVRTCMELDSPSFVKPAFVPTESFSSLVSVNLRKAREALLELLGDENMFRQNVQLPYEYHIDFEIWMDSDRKKVLPVTAADSHAEISVQRLAFLFVPPSAFCLGTTHPQGNLAMKKRHLSKLGYHVILVLNKKFQELTNESAIEFLKEKIYSENISPLSEVNLYDNN
uniref:FAST kinase domains 2 n=1 Tax=Meleagris gallopavo TaxID=9103 RepID=G1N8R8_MELGA